MFPIEGLLPDLAAVGLVGLPDLEPASLEEVSKQGWAESVITNIWWGRNVFEDLYPFISGR